MENAAEIERVITESFGRCDKLPNGLLRCERRHADVPWSIVLFDTSGAIPKTESELAQYMDQNLSKSYFTSSPSYLKWNHYLVFVHEDNSAGEYRELIENDANYARKLLVSRSSLSQFLKGYQPQAPQDLSGVDTFSRWANVLDEAGLGAVVDDTARATLVHDYLAAEQIVPTGPRATSTSKVHAEDEILLRFMQELRIRSFLPYPPHRPYSFGSVNLISGVNGAGKTSLLEAIEHFYCGATLRSELEPIWNADLQAKFKGVDRFIGSETAAEVFRARDLRWYGRNYDRKNKLAESFNQYNFYNSDAAYKFVYEEDIESQKDALSRLALGDDANRLWDRVVKTLKLFEDEKRSYSKLVIETHTRLMSMAREIERVRTPSSTVQVLFARLREHLSGLLWKKVPASLDDIDTGFIDDFQAAAESMNLTARLAWMAGPLTVNRINAELKEVSIARQQILTLQSQLSQQRQLLARLESEHRSMMSRRDDLLKLKRYLEIDFPKLLDIQRKAQASAKDATVLVAVSAILAGTSVSLSDVDSLPAVEDAVERMHALSIKEHAELSTALAQAEATTSSKARAIAGIRSLALELLQVDQDTIECPLCGTNFQTPEQLRSHIDQQKPKENTSWLEELRLKLQSNERTAEVIREFLNFVRNSYVLANYLELDPEKLTIPQVRLQAEAAKREHDNGLRLSSEVANQLGLFKDTGLTIDEYETLYSGFVGAAANADSASTQLQVLSALESQAKDISDNQSRVGLARGELEDLQSKWFLAASGWTTSTSDEEILREVDAKHTSLGVVAQAIASVTPRMELGADQDLKDTLLRIQIARDVLQELSETTNAERKRNVRLEELLGAKGTLEAKRKRYSEKEARCDKAIDPLRYIVQDDSRDMAVDDFLTRNHQEISNVFARIHAPLEFRGLSSNGRSLVALDGKRTRSFRQISTGQRSAVALSVFLTLNGMLRKGPPLLMFDDPVTAIDDLNVLAFLDHLRDIAIGSSRQIFFATANEKVASLFEKKFAFLGDKEFRTIQLSRINVVASAA